MQRQTVAPACVPPIRLRCGSGPETTGCRRCARGVRAEHRRARKQRSARRLETVSGAGNVGSDAVHRRRGRNMDQGADLTDDGDRMRVWTRVEGIVVCVIPHREKSEHHARRDQRDQPDLLAHDAHGRSSSTAGRSMPRRPAAVKHTFVDRIGAARAVTVPGTPQLPELPDRVRHRLHRKRCAHG